MTLAEHVALRSGTHTCQNPGRGDPEGSSLPHTSGWFGLLQSPGNLGDVCPLRRAMDSCITPVGILAEGKGLQCPSDVMGRKTRMRTVVTPRCRSGTQSSHGGWDSPQAAGAGGLGEVRGWEPQISSPEGHGGQLKGPGLAMSTPQATWEHCCWFRRIRN